MSDDRTHGACSPSVLKRRLSCPGSLTLEAVMPDNKSESASMGTRLHKLLEKDVWEEKDLEGLTEYHLAALERARQFRETLKIPSDYVSHRELEIDLSWIHPLIEKGHVDEVFVKQYDRAILIDWKFFFQKKLDPAETNTQMICYAAGVCREFEVEEVEVHLFMPHVNAWSTATFKRKYLMGRASHFAESVEMAKLNPFSFESGDHCEYCRAMSICPVYLHAALSEKDASKESVSNHPVNLMPKLLEKAEMLSDWSGALKKYAFALLAAGKKIPGWGLIQGEGHRKWIDVEKAGKELTKIAEEKRKDAESLYDPRSLKSPSEVEKVLGKAKRVAEVMAKLVFKPKGELKLARKEEAKE